MDVQTGDKLVSFYIDQYGKKWLIWGDKTEADMAEWVESIYRQTREAELKAKLIIVGSVVGTVIIGYSAWQIKKSFTKWNHHRTNIERLEAERKESERNNSFREWNITTVKVMPVEKPVKEVLEYA